MISRHADLLSVAFASSCFSIYSQRQLCSNIQNHALILTHTAVPLHQAHILCSIFEEFARILWN